VVDKVLRVDTPCGPAWRRYNYDGYGPGSAGQPYMGFGIGRAWPLLGGERAHYELAAGRDVRPFVTAFEKFASPSGLLPEQVWDQPDLPAAGMFLGKSSGSAMPLVWAHAEYIKLLRSVNDGKIFDLIPVVADRYLRGKGRKDLEVWKQARRVRAIAAGSVLRIISSAQFRLRWTPVPEAAAGVPAPLREVASQASGLGLNFVDVPTTNGQNGALRFSFVEAGTALPEDDVHQVGLEPGK
jgi:glucoamylase